MIDREEVERVASRMEQIGEIAAGAITEPCGLVWHPAEVLPAAALLRSLLAERDESIQVSARIASERACEMIRAEKAEAELARITQIASDFSSENVRLEAERDEAIKELAEPRDGLVKAIYGQPCPTQKQWEQMQRLIDTVKLDERGAAGLLSDYFQLACALGRELTAANVEIEQLRATLAHRQAKIDMLMHEYCPEDMTKEQLEEWGRNQVPAAWEP